MIRKPVVSSHIASVGFDSYVGTLEVEFKDGTVYRYFEVPTATYQQLITAGSVGKYLAENIWSKYHHAKVA